MVRRKAFVLDDTKARDRTVVVPIATVFALSGAAPTTSATATTT